MGALRFPGPHRSHQNGDEQPLRAELLSVEQLERHAKGLAGWHQEAPRRGPDRLLPRLRENEAVLLDAHEVVMRAADKGLRIVPAAEWLLDNFYLIEEQIRTARRHLPRNYSRELPQLANGPRAGYPRIYDLALELISHVDGRIDGRGLSSFAAAYQTIQTLRMGELWAIPIMLRLALIENLRRVSARIAAGRRERDLAVEWGGRLVEVGEADPKNLVLVLADLVRAEIPLSSAFVAELCRQIQGKNPALSFALSWLDQRLAEQGQTAEQLTQIENQNQAADQVSIGNSIGSLRFLGAMDWREFVETGSIVEQTLRGDPAGVYTQMDFATRDRYRHTVERIARRSRLSEQQVAQKAIDLAHEAAGSDAGGAARPAHVGYFLIDKGLPQLQRAAKMRWTAARAVGRMAERLPLPLYLGAIALIALAVWIGFLFWARSWGMQGWRLWLFSLLPLVCGGQLAVAVVNWLASVLVPPRVLPRMNFAKGIPPDQTTAVVVPTMLSSLEGVEDVLEGLELRYLANRDPNLYFALLTDYRDALQQTQEDDDALLLRASEGIAALNQKYKGDRPCIFFLLHRPRRWNEQEGLWMGWERKRGKLAEFNALLRGGPRDRFSAMIGDESLLPTIRYVITLDTDTQLPRDAARKLVGTIAHPLNRPSFDPVKGRVTEGYTILQPRVAVSLPSASRSWFARLFAGDPGIDPYTRAVSDVYQDVFGEGSFIGKGIYEVDTFERACGARFPENLILSHDLLESCHARSALVSDVELFEEHPSRYTADVSRRHRWIRGDWQILWWLLPRVPGPDARRVANPVSGLSRWKILDNLRRSLTPPAVLLFLLVAWILLRHPMGVATTIFVIGLLIAPFLLASLLDLVRKPSELPLSMHLGYSARLAARQLGQFAFTLVFLPYDAYMSLDAVLRTLGRLFITRRKLLEWQTASDSERNARIDLRGFARSMWIGPVLAAGLAVVLSLTKTHPWPYAAPLMGLWFLSPAAAWWLSRPIRPREVRLNAEQLVFLSNVARRTWRYFEVFVGAEDHWLPPDNIQEHPVAAIAHRTSPTNIGMALLAYLSAYDFGYIPGGDLLDRSAKTLSTLQQLQRHRGHFYNWYDTHTLRGLNPLYISTVDSGNLAAHLLVCRQGLLELEGQEILPERAFAGLQDTLHVLLETARAGRVQGAVGPAPDMVRRLERMVADMDNPPRTLTAAANVLQSLVMGIAEVATALGAYPDEEMRWWAHAAERDIRGRLADLKVMAPWALLRPPTEQLWRRGSAEQVKRLSELRDILRRLEQIPTLGEVAGLSESLLPAIDTILAGAPGGNGNVVAEDDTWFTELRRQITAARDEAAKRIAAAQGLAQQCAELAGQMDFGFLLDPTRDLLSIGYNVADHRLDASFYDLLASEARLTSFLGVAEGQLTQEHWFALGRMLTRSGGAPALLSWSGSMFEYLMPLLVMPTFENTLLDETCCAVVSRQIEYGEQRGVPWGMSESGYNATDVQFNYQYRAFGVPGLGFKRGLAEDLVIAPYATVMALMVAPRPAVRNLRRLASDGRLGPYGYYEAVDYTPSRLPPDQTSVTVRSFMAHHQGMSLLSLAYVLLGKPMQRRFYAEERFRATDMLLQERVPKAAAPVYPHPAEASAMRIEGAEEQGIMRVFTSPSPPAPEVHLLSNGRYHVMVTSAGGGYSRWRDLAVTRWQEDATRDCWGAFCYLRDAESGEFWSAAYQPTLRGPGRYEAIFTQARAEFRRRDVGIDTYTQISVSPEDDIELRRVTITNRSGRARVIELTTYAEIVLANPAADAAHPVFSKLFVQTDIVPNRQAIMATRRPRSANEPAPWMFNLMTVEGTTVGPASYETDRSRFIGRGRTLANPAAMAEGGPLSNSEGSVLDPIVAIRRLIRLDPDESATIDIILGVAETREAASSLLEKYHDPRLTDRVFELAWTHSQVVLRQLNSSEAEAQVYGRLAGSVLYASGLRRADPAVLSRNRRPQSGLWGHGISGDLPIVLLRIGDQNRLDLVREVVAAHAYWRLKGLTVDLVIWNEDESGYRQYLQDQIMGVIAASPEAGLIDRPGGVFVRRSEHLPEEDRVLLQAAARVVLSDSAGRLAEQVDRRRAELALAPFSPMRPRFGPAPTAVETPQRDLVFNNGYGGFTRDGREYVIILAPDQATPAPWVNILANANFGTLVSESGASYTWSENSHEFRLTPWYNDPVIDATGEAFYIRDEESGRFWSPTPRPARGPMPYVTRHGFGYSVFEYTQDGITTELTLYVAVDAPVKFALFRIHNGSGRTRRLSLTGYWEWALGEQRSRTYMHVVTDTDPKSGAILAHNPFSIDFSQRFAFANASEATRLVTADRTEFLGRNGGPASPAAMRRARLSGRVGAGLDPCAAIQIPIELADGQHEEYSFIIGAAGSEDEACNLAERYRGTTAAHQALEAVWEYWKHTLGVVYVETPDPAIDLLTNGWLVYQVLACRLWGRTGFYQSGGAFGFRDQLQDVMALLHNEPRLLREHLLRAASRQFRDGDVQHWWHPPVGRGVRTHISDDYLWLPYATARYVLATADTGALDERVHFLEGRPLKPEEEGYYDLPARSEESGTLYEHCVRAINHGLRFGEHGLPLMGAGDWNDGMNLVGAGGKGESVWLAFFLYDVLTQFAQTAQLRGDKPFAQQCTTQAQTLRQNIERNAWDGSWYRRAYFDNGEPLGAAINPECQIDSLPQSWSVLSKAGEPQRSRQAMAAVDQRLVRRDAGLIQLFDPPFDKSHLNPGYIKGYVPGVRENGGQYTHAAVWTTMAFAAMYDAPRAWELFRLINPVRHGSTPAGIDTYKVEPYVAAADVYAVPPHTGRGGWTWYTGSAGWMYRLIVENLLGVRLEVDKLHFAPLLPPEWSSFRLHYRYRETFYHITIRRAAAPAPPTPTPAPAPTGQPRVTRVVVDGVEQADMLIAMVDDRVEHQAEVEVGA